MDIASVLTVLALALALAVQPWSVLAAVLLVTAENGPRKNVAFACGWLIALIAVAVITIAMSPAVPTKATRSAAFSWAEIAVGVALGAFALRRWHSAAGQTTSHEPGWMKRLDSMSPVSAFVLGAFLPNYVLVVAAMGELLTAGLTGGQLAVAAFAFAVVSSLGVAAPLLIGVIRPKDAAQLYANWRGWLTAHSQQMVGAIIGVIALALIVKGIGALVT